jgi:hypothetical protein
MRTGPSRVLGSDGKKKGGRVSERREKRMEKEKVGCARFSGTGTKIRIPFGDENTKVDSE